VLAYSSGAAVQVSADWSALEQLALAGIASETPDLKHLHFEITRHADTKRQLVHSCHMSQACCFEFLKEVTPTIYTDVRSYPKHTPQGSSSQQVLFMLTVKSACSNKDSSRRLQQDSPPAANETQRDGQQAQMTDTAAVPAAANLAGC